MPLARILQAAVATAATLMPLTADTLAAATERPATLARCAPLVSGQHDEDIEHGGGLNACGCHFNRKTGECHCHQARGCGCECQPAGCPVR